MTAVDALADLSMGQLLSGLYAAIGFAALVAIGTSSWVSWRVSRPRVETARRIVRIAAVTFLLIRLVDLAATAGAQYAHGQFSDAFNACVEALPTIVTVSAIYAAVSFMLWLIDPQPHPGEDDYDSDCDPVPTAADARTPDGAAAPKCRAAGTNQAQEAPE